MGLAAPQVGVNVRLMVFNEAGVKGKGEEVGAAAAAAAAAPDGAAAVAAARHCVHGPGCPCSCCRKAVRSCLHRGLHGG